MLVFESITNAMHLDVIQVLIEYSKKKEALKERLGSKQEMVVFRGASVNDNQFLEETFQQIIDPLNMIKKQVIEITGSWTEV